MADLKRYENALRSAVPAARIVELPGAAHYIFRSNETDVPRGMKAFVARLPEP